MFSINKYKNYDCLKYNEHKKRRNSITNLKNFQ